MQLVTSRKRMQEISVTPESLAEQWIKQCIENNAMDIRCYYTNLQMSLRYHSDWSISVERKDQSIGYTVENTVFCVVEMNGAKQWSFAKLDMLANFAADNKPIQLTPEQKIQLRQWCKKRCIEARTANNERNAANRRKSSSNSEFSYVEMQHTIQPQDIEQMFVQQNGLCFYSKYSMTYSATRRDWMMSIERLDNTIGYVLSNIVLICREFNTPKQWTREKFLTMITSYRNHKLTLHTQHQ